CKKWPISARRSKVRRNGAKPGLALPRQTAIRLLRVTIGTWPPSTTGLPSGPTMILASATSRFTKRSGNAFSNYARLADHKIEPVSVPFKDQSIPAWIHLPPGYSGGKVPVVIAIPGMDSFKEATVALANDRWMERGVAVLSIDGPGAIRKSAARRLC